MRDIPDVFLPNGADLRLPMVFAARNAVRVRDWADGSLWTATVKAYREGEPSRIFDDVAFFSKGSLAGIIGIESESGYPTDLPHEVAIRQQEFIAYLRKERQRKVSSLGLMARCFEGWEYSTEAAATASFMALCTGLTDIAVGFHDDHGEYKIFRVDAGDTGNDWLDIARRVPPFELLD